MPVCCHILLVYSFIFLSSFLKNYPFFPHAPQPFALLSSFNPIKFVPSCTGLEFTTAVVLILGLDVDTEKTNDIFWDIS
jgi:hypothetical protein